MPKLYPLPRTTLALLSKSEPCDPRKTSTLAPRTPPDRMKLNLALRKIEERLPVDALLAVSISSVIVFKINDNSM